MKAAPITLNVSFPSYGDPNGMRPIDWAFLFAPLIILLMECSPQ